MGEVVRPDQSDEGKAAQMKSEQREHWDRHFPENAIIFGKVSPISNTVFSGG